MIEHRRYVRCQVNRQGWLKLEQVAEELLCQVKDISFKGARIALSAKLPEDSAVRISLRLSEDCSFDAEIWVAWHKVFDGVNHYGIYFDKIRDADKDKIQTFLNKYCFNELKQKWWPDKIAKEGGDKEMNDRRIFERFSTRFPARFLSRDSASEGQAQTLDISAKGMGLETAQELKLRSDVEIWLDLPDKGGPLYARGQVVWSRQQGLNNFHSGVELEKADLMGISRALRP